MTKKYLERNVKDLILQILMCLTRKMESKLIGYIALTQQCLLWRSGI